MLEGKEDILNIFTGFDKKSIFNVLLLIILGRHSSKEIDLLRGSRIIALFDSSFVNFLS